MSTYNLNQSTTTATASEEAFSCAYEDNDASLSLSALTSVVTLAVLLIVVILVGNGLIIGVVVKFPCLRTAQNIFFCSLSVSDFTLAVTVLPLSIIREVLGYWPLGSFLCKIYLAIDIFLCTASIWNLCLISINRYFAFTMGKRYRRMCSIKRILTMVAVGWIWSGFVCLPGFIFSKSLAIEDDPTVCTHSTERWYILFSVSGSFYIPLVIMVAAYGRISWLLNKMANNSNIRAITLQRQKRVQLMTGIVLGAFIVCWFPFFQTYVTTSLCATCCVHPQFFKFLEWFAYCNSAVNPFIYSMTKSDLRQYVNLVLRNRTAVMQNHQMPRGRMSEDGDEAFNSAEMRQMQSISKQGRLVKLPNLGWRKPSSSAPQPNNSKHPLSCQVWDMPPKGIGSRPSDASNTTNWEALLTTSTPRVHNIDRLSQIREEKDISTPPMQHNPREVVVSVIGGTDTITAISANGVLPSLQNEDENRNVQSPHATVERPESAAFGTKAPENDATRL